MKGILANFEKEIRGGVNDDLLRIALNITRTNDYLDGVIRVMRDSVRKSHVCKFNDRLHLYNGAFYEPITYDQFRYALEEVMRDKGIGAAFWARIVNSCVSETTGKEITSVPNNLVCFSNGIVNFDKIDDQDFAIMPFSPKHSVFYQLTYPFDAKADHPIWDRFLDEVLPPKELQMILQEFLGLIFVDRDKSKIETMLWLLGEGANGKSVVFESIMGILGRENCTNVDLAELVGGGNRDKNIARINGKLLNYCSEVSRRAISTDFAKALISGEPLPAREMYGNPFTAYNIPLIMANTNKMPRVADLTNAFFRRILIIPFDVTIPTEKQDKHLAYKIGREYSGVLNWILEGRKRILANNFRFTHSPLAQRMVDEYRGENDTISSWVASARFLPRPANKSDLGYFINTTDFYSEYMRWCVALKVAKSLRVEGTKKFSAALEGMGFIKERKAQGFFFKVYGFGHARF
jgi:putative DNA primase/helicase